MNKENDKENDKETDDNSYQIPSYNDDDQSRENDRDDRARENENYTPGWWHSKD